MMMRYGQLARDSSRSAALWSKQELAESTRPVGAHLCRARLRQWEAEVRLVSKSSKGFAVFAAVRIKVFCCSLPSQIAVI
jgi:hypothetical protein